MSRRRLAALALGTVTAVAAPGCRAYTNGNALARTAPPVAARPSPTVEQVAARINQNARNIRGIRAQPTISLSGSRLRRMAGAGAPGMMALVKPNNFRLVLKSPGGGREMADLGSNANQFWFANAEEQKIYVGQYGPDGRVPAGVPMHMQPDWLVEALGLRPLSAEEIAAATVKKNAGGTLTLTFPRRSPTGESFRKSMVVDPMTGEVREHVLQDADGRVLAKAEIRRYQRVTGPGPDGQGDVAASLPAEVKVTWLLPEDLTLYAVLGDVELNPPAADFGDDFFVRPEKPGYVAMMIEPEANAYASAPSTIRETRPAPSTPDGAPGEEPPNPVHIDGLVPLGDDGAMRTGGPAPLDDDLPPSEIEPEAVIGARMPRPPASPADETIRSDRSTRPIPIER